MGNFIDYLLKRLDLKLPLISGVGTYTPQNVTSKSDRCGPLQEVKWNVSRFISVSQTELGNMVREWGRIGPLT